MSEHLNVGDVTGPRWAGGTRNPEKRETVAERAWREHPDEMARAHTELQVAVLREQLAETVLRETLAKATLKRIYKMAVEDDVRAWDSHWPLIALITEPYRTGDTNA